VPLFPPLAPSERPVAVAVDGRPVASYAAAYLLDGRVFAAVDPILTRLADRVWISGRWLVVQRGARRVRIFLVPRAHRELSATFVAVGPVLRWLGESVRYDPHWHRLDIRTPQARTVTTPTPFTPNTPSPAPSPVFTPTPFQTPRPIWSGTPMPRRTPLPVPAPAATGR
jgi:hypothetical protein